MAQRTDSDRPRSAFEAWFRLICRCENKTHRHACHVYAENAAEALGDPTDRDRGVLRVIKGGKADA